MQDLIQEPLWRPEHLGLAIPESPHAVSVCLPTWRDNIGYEEREPRVVEKLQAGYPRFVYNPLCRKLFEVCRQRFAGDSQTCQVYPSGRAAARFCGFFRSMTGESPQVREYGLADVKVVCFSERHISVAKDYWQHSGEGVSSRQAEACLTGQWGEPAGNVRRLIRERLAGLAGVEADCVALFPSGMAATFAVYRALGKLFPQRKSIQFGFPYVDTLKIQQKFGVGVHLFPKGDPGELHELGRLLEREPVSGLFTEFPSNPLLISPDLAVLSELSRRHHFPLVVDETIASLANVDLVSTADVVCTSLTKFFSGVGNVMGGAILLNSQGPFYNELSELLAGEGEDLLWTPDLAVIEQNSHDFEQRVKGINERAETLAEFLASHRRVQRVYYPKFETPAAYCAFQRPGGGFGGLLSFTLHHEATAAPQVFDALRICKGPNLGMSYTLACPYTLLAHYGELEFAESCGMSRYLIRVSVGLEEADDLIERFGQALVAAD